jgi:hypothetical protein
MGFYEVYKGEHKKLSQDRTELKNELSLSSPLLLSSGLIPSLDPRLLQVRWLPQATLYRPHAPILTGGNGV